MPGQTLVVTPASDPTHHIDNLTMETVFFEGRNHYFESLDAGEGDHPDFWQRPVVPQLRELLTRFESAAAHDVVFECTSTVVSRSRRSFIMEQELRIAGEGRLVATCRSVHVTVDTAAGVVAEVPGWLWTAIESREGRDDNQTFG